MNSHKCGYSECNTCNRYVGKNHKCFMKKVKAKGGYCMVDSKKPCKNDDSIKKKDWCYSCRTCTEKYIFTISKLPKTQAHTPLTFQSHKTSKEMNTYTTI